MLEKIKIHIKEHKMAYTCGAAGFVIAGFTMLIMKERYVVARGVACGPKTADNSVTMRSFFIFSKENTIAPVLHRGGTGSPSYIVECLETGEAWLSQRQAATATNVLESALSGHLNGKFPDVDGLHFRRIGLAAA